MHTRILPFIAALLTASLFFPNCACALSFHDFGKMNDDDDANFVTFMVIGTAKMLRAQGKPEEATKLITYFKDPGKNGGFNQLAQNGKMMHNLNNRNAINPNNRAPVYEVEDALELTLKDYGMAIPVSSLKALARNFHPNGPPRGKAPVSPPAPE